MVALHNDGSTKVIAHIEASSNVTQPNETLPIETSTSEKSQSSTDSSGSSVVIDEGSVSTGETISICFVISLISLVISAIIIYICGKIGKNNKLNSCGEK